MPRPPLPESVVAARRAIAAVPGTRSAHAREANISLPAWCGFVATYNVVEVPPAPGTRRQRPGSASPSTAGAASARPGAPPAPSERAGAHPPTPSSRPGTPPPAASKPSAAPPSTPRGAPAAAQSRATPPAAPGSVRAPESAGDLVGRAVALLLVQRGRAMRVDELAAELRVPVERLRRALEQEATACGRVAEGEALGTFRAACASCGRPY